PEAPAAPAVVADQRTDEMVAEPAATPSNSLPRNSLQEFLSGTMQVAGKKITLETTEMDAREGLRPISAASGVTLRLSADVRRTVRLKRRQVPWDQMLVMVRKTKKLGYTRAGNVLRIAPMTDIRSEEEDSVRLSAQRKAQEPLKVRMI